MVGFGFGDVVIANLLEGRIPEPLVNKCLIISNDYKKGILILNLVRESGFCAEIYYKTTKLSNAMMFAEKKKFNKVIIILENSDIMLKDMVKKSQITINKTELISSLNK